MTLRWVSDQSSQPCAKPDAGFRKRIQDRKAEKQRAAELANQAAETPAQPPGGTPAGYPLPPGQDDRQTTLHSSERDMSFGDRIRTLRTEQGMTAKELSTLSTVPEKTIYRIETGEVSDPKLSTIELLIKALNCSADDLIFDKDSFSNLGRLKQLFLNFAEMEKHEQDFLLEVIRKVTLGQAMERHVNTPILNGTGQAEEAKITA